MAGVLGGRLAVFDGKELKKEMTKARTQGDLAKERG